MRPQIESQVAKLGLSDRVDMPGVVTDVVSEYRNAFVVVVPSRYESFGLIAVEALASARLVIGFADALGQLEIAVDGPNAVLVDDEGDREASLAAGLRVLMQDGPQRRRISQVGPVSAQRFARESVVDQWKALLRHCVPAE